MNCIFVETLTVVMYFQLKHKYLAVLLMDSLSKHLSTKRAAGTVLLYKLCVSLKILYTGWLISNVSSLSVN